MAIIVHRGEVKSQSPIQAADHPLAGGIRTVDLKAGSLSSDYLSPESLQFFARTLDAALVQWKAALPESKTVADDTRIDGYIMRDESVFRMQGLIDPRVPNFPYGYALADEFWLRAQPDENYTRHLMLHEAFHSFVWQHFGSVGPHWLAEGLAEMFATHQIVDGEARVGIVPPARSGFEQWGRFRRLKEMRDAQKVPTLPNLFAVRPNLKGDVATYAASWLAVRLIRARPATRKIMDQWIATDLDQLTPSKVVRDLGDQWLVTRALWKLAALEADFGETITVDPPDLKLNFSMWDGQPTRHQVPASVAWFVVPQLYEPGSNVTIFARGNVTLADHPKPWLSEPEGITIRYHRGEPLGKLTAIWLPVEETDSERSSGLLSLPAIQSTGSKKQLETPKKRSWLLLRVNDVAGELGDNRGSYEVVIR